MARQRMIRDVLSLIHRSKRERLNVAIMKDERRNALQEKRVGANLSGKNLTEMSAINRETKF